MISSQLQLTKTNYNKLAFCITSSFYAVFLGVFITSLHNVIDLNITKGHSYNSSFTLNLVEVEEVIRDHVIEESVQEIHEEIKEEKVEAKERALDGFHENKAIIQEPLKEKKEIQEEVKKEIKKEIKKEVPIKAQKVQDVQKTKVQKVKEQNVANNKAISNTTTPNTKESAIAKGDMDVNLSYGNNNNNILAHFKKAIDKNLVYERRARLRKLSGTVLLEFRFTKDRELSFVRILKSSGHNLLDENAIATIKKAYKDFPKVSSNYLIKIPITYRLI